MHFLHKYLSKTEIVDLNEKKFASSKVEHIFIPTKAKVKEEVLLELFQVINPYLALIFVNTKTKVDELATYLSDHGYKVGKIHGDMEDRDRKQILKRIKSLEFQYVVASDIASRGIDIIGVSHVINFELPDDVEFYVHRSGRTARAAFTGQAISLYEYESEDYVNRLKAKGLKVIYKKIENGAMVDTLIRKKASKKGAIDILSSELHQKTPLSKRVKPGYKKKRKEVIEKQIKQAKKAQISEIYKRRAKNENRVTREQ
jgi:ATP-dependent RNA helicase CshB